MTKMKKKADHLRSIETAIVELALLEDRTRAPNPIPHQYIGTIVDNTLGLLTASANSLDNGVRIVTFSDDKNWLSLMQAVHRSFFSSIHIAIEISFERILEDRNIQVENKQQIKLNKELKTFEPIDKKLEAFITKIIKGIPLNFKDKLNAVLKLTSLSNNEKKKWRKFFIGMTIVRNKVSHSNPTLTQQQQEDLKQGGLQVLVSENGNLKANPRMYKQFAEFSLNFFDLMN